MLFFLNNNNDNNNNNNDINTNTNTTTTNNNNNNNDNNNNNNGVECSDKWYEHSPKSVEENEEVKLLWDFTIQTDREIHHRRPDIVIQKKKAKETIIVDIAVPGDSNIL